MRALLLLLTFLLGACGPTLGGRQFGGIDWRAADVNGVPLVAGTTLTLRLDGRDQVSGNAGCNSFTGSYQMMSREGIRFTGLSATRKACAPEVMEQEQRYLAILGFAQGYSLYGDGGVSIITPDGRAIRFRR